MQMRFNEVGIVCVCGREGSLYQTAGDTQGYVQDVSRLPPELTFTISLTVMVLLKHSSLILPLEEVCNSVFDWNL